MKVSYRGLALSFFLSSHVFAQSPGLGTLRVEISGIKDGQGQVMVALEKTPDDFDKGEWSVAKYRGQYAQAQGDKLVLEFKDVPYGTYAIKSFHDVNKNAKLDTNMLGVPTESYGFSNNARRTFGPAHFKDAQFQLDEELKVVSIVLK